MRPESVAHLKLMPKIKISIHNMFEVTFRLTLAPKKRWSAWTWTKPKQIDMVEQKMDRFIKSINKEKYFGQLVGEEALVADVLKRAWLGDI
jgi:hypothetical protein